MVKPCAAAEDWRESAMQMDDKIRHVLRTGLYSDVTLVVNDGIKKKKFEVHEFVLRLSSCVFDRALNGDFKESFTKVMEINNIGHGIFDLFLKFLYNEKINLASVEQSMELYKVAHRYMVSNLKSFCIQHIKTHKSSATACIGFEFANFYMITDLKAEYLKIFQEQTMNVNFQNATIETLNTILSLDWVNLSGEISLFEIIEKWIWNRVKNEGGHIKEELCQELIPKIRYMSMTPKEFTDGPVQSKLLTYDQWPAILANIASENCPLPLPDGFDKKRRTYGCYNSNGYYYSNGYVMR